MIRSKTSFLFFFFLRNLFYFKVYFIYFRFIIHRIKMTENVKYVFKKSYEYFKNKYSKKNIYIHTFVFIYFICHLFIWEKMIQTQLSNEVEKISNLFLLSTKSVKFVFNEKIIYKDQCIYYLNQFYCHFINNT